MKTPYLEISQTHGQIGLKSSKPFLKIQQQPADLQIRQQHGDNIKISKKAAQLFIDQTEAFADANIKGPLRRATEYAQGTKQKLLQYLAKTAQQGEQLMKIENGFGKIPQIAAENSKLFTKEFGMGWTPQSANRIKMSFQPAELDFSVSRSEPNISVTPRPVQIQAQPWQTDVYIKQKNNLAIRAVGLHVNQGL